MEKIVGFGFHPTEEELVDHYLRLKNIGGSNTTEVDQVISTVSFCNLEPCELPQQSRMASSNQVWYFFGRKESKYKRGERQKRKTKTGFWKKTGPTLSIKRNRGNGHKIGEKRVLVFHNNGSKSNWVMHEYHSSNDNGTYTICKVQFKGDASEISSSGVHNVEHSHSLATTPLNGLVVSEVGGILDNQQKIQFEADTHKAFEDLQSNDWLSLLNDDGDE